MQNLHYQEMPLAIQDLVDGAESLSNIEITEFQGQVAYRFYFEDSSETWTKVYDAKGKLLAKGRFMEKVK